MYVCKPGLLMRLVCWLLMLALLPEIFFCLYMLSQCQLAERTLYLGGALIFGALFLMLARRLVWLGAAWLEYDDEKVIFHLNRAEEEVVPWAELPSAAVNVRLDGRTIFFRFLPASAAEREVQIAVTPMFSGYRDFRQECERRGVLRPPLTAEQAYAAMSPYLRRMLDDAENRTEDKQ